MSIEGGHFGKGLVNRDPFLLALPKRKDCLLRVLGILGQENTSLPIGREVRSKMAIEHGFFL